jgi:hypothetical protein
MGLLPLAQVGVAMMRRLAARYGRDRTAAEGACEREARALLGTDAPRGWRAGEALAWRRWSPLVAALPGVAGWSPAEKAALVEVIPAKGGVLESDLVARFDAHAPLRETVREGTLTCEKAHAYHAGVRPHRCGGLAAWTLATAMTCGIAHAADGFDLQGHRGARGLAPENTLAAFRKALEIGVTALELDLAMTRDGVLVVSHDPLLNPDIVRGADAQWLSAPGPAINTLTLAELKRYDIGRVNPRSRYARQLPAARPGPAGTSRAA